MIQHLQEVVQHGNQTLAMEILLIPIRQSRFTHSYLSSGAAEPHVGGARECLDCKYLGPGGLKTENLHLNIYNLQKLSPFRLEEFLDEAREWTKK